MLRALVLLALAAGAFAAPEDELTIVVTGDGRADRRENRPSDRDGVNVAILDELVAATVQEGAAAFLFSGDLVSGSDDPAEFETQLRTWMAHVKPLLEKKIRVLPIRGNHEAGKPGSAAAAKRRQLYLDLVARPCDVPADGPAGEERLTFALRLKNTLIVGLDQFAGDKVAVNAPWLEGVLSKSDALHVIPFGHEMAFTSGHHEDHMGGERGDILARDRFWNALAKSKVAWFFAGHDHLYDRMAVTPAGGGFTVRQVIAGTAGAPFYPMDEYFKGDATWSAKQEFNRTGAYGYVVVKIAGKTAGMTFKARSAEGGYAPIDEWSYTR